MINTPINFLISICISFAATVPLRDCIEPTKKTWLENVYVDGGFPDFFLPEAQAIEHEPVACKNKLLPPSRPRRQAEMEDFGMESVSFEVPTIVRVNNDDVQVSPLNGGQPAAFNHGTSAQCVPQNPTPRPPVSLTICIDNVIPPGKADKYVIRNTSQIRGCGIVLKISLLESKTTQNPSDLIFSFDFSTPPPNKMELQNKKKVEEEEEEDEPAEQKSLQEMLRKILAGKYNTTTQPPDQLPALLQNSSREPLTFLFNPAMIHNFPAKFDSTTSRRPTNHNSKGPNPPDYDYLSKVVEQLSSNMPKQKLASLLSGLIAKAYPGNK